MKLANSQGESFHLKIVGYQFHQLHGNEDDDWLNIQIQVSHERGGWRHTDPSLTTVEMQELINWLRALAEGRDCEPELHMTEPNLHFEVRAKRERKQLRIYFELESRPAWMPKGYYPNLNDCWIDFEMDSKALQKQASLLEKQLKQFPTRHYSSAQK